MNAVEPMARNPKASYHNNMPVFTSESDVLRWYEGEPRVLTPEFCATVPWNETKRTPIDPTFIPVLQYMRDIETFTTLYRDQLMKSASGKNPVIVSFLNRWAEEEPTHGALLNRFMEEAGYPAERDWNRALFTRLPDSYHRRHRMRMSLTSVFGSRFSAVHMTWGAIQEHLTLTGYVRLWTLAKHPVLETILRAIVREEARHALFYWSIAKLKLDASGFCRRLARTLVDRFWKPVGEDVKTPAETNTLLHTLFSGHSGIEHLTAHVNNRIAQLPGFETFSTVSRRVSQGKA